MENSEKSNAAANPVKKFSAATAAGILKYIFAAWIIVIFMTPEQFKSGAYSFSAVIFGAAAFILFKKLYVRAEQLTNRKFLISSLILTALFMIQLSVTQLFAGFAPENTAARLVMQPIFIIFLTAAVFITIGTLLNYALTSKRNPDAEKPLRKIPYINLYYAVLPTIAVTAAYVIAGYPSYSYPDTVGIWERINNNVWEEWHTVAFLLYCRIFSLNLKSQYAISVFQGIFWVLISNYAIGIMSKHSESKRLCVIYAILTAVIFTPEIYCGVMLKDPIYCMCHFLLFAALFDFLGSEKHSAKQYIILTAAAIFTSVFRHAAFPSVFCTLAVLCVYIIKKKINCKNLMISILSTVIGVVFIGSILPHNILHAAENPAYVKYSVPMYLVGALSNKIDSLDAEDVYVMEQIMPLQRWKEASASDKYWADTVSRTWGGIGSDIEKLNDPAMEKEVLLLNMRLLLKYPYQYISSAFDISSIVWEIGRPSDGYELAPVDGGSPYDGALKRNIGTAATRSLSVASFANPLFNPIYWRGGLWLFIIGFSIIVLILKNRLKYIIPAILPVMTSLLLLISIPAQDPRYIIYLIECGLFMLFFTMGLGNECEQSSLRSDTAVQPRRISGKRKSGRSRK